MRKRLKTASATHWSEQEVEKLIQLVGQSLPEARLCKLLGRTPEQVRQKMKELAIALPNPSQPPALPDYGRRNLHP
jgi:hypothetical protein